MAYSLYNFPQHKYARGIASRPRVTPPYRFSSPVIVSGVPDPQFKNYTGTSPLSADVSSFNEGGYRLSKFPMLQQFNLSLQYELLPNLLVEVSYGGARGVHWVQRIDLNRCRSEALLGRTRKRTVRITSSPAERGSTAGCKQLVQFRQPENRTAILAWPIAAGELRSARYRFGARASARTASRPILGR